jgi:hypothetical protein
MRRVYIFLVSDEDPAENQVDKDASFAKEHVICIRIKLGVSDSSQCTEAKAMESMEKGRYGALWIVEREFPAMLAGLDDGPKCVKLPPGEFVENVRDDRPNAAE